MAAALTPTYGVWFVTLWVQTLLQGCGMLQAWLYFHWYKNDKWSIRAMVAILLAIETFQSVVFFQITYFYLIDGFGDFAGLGVIHWQDSAQLFAILLSAFVVHLYFAHVIYALDTSEKILPIMIVILSLTQIGAGLAEAIITSKITFFAQLGEAKSSRSLQSVAAFMCDVIIAASLVKRLGSSKSNVKSTNSMVYKLMIIAINRGSLTAVCALLNLILFLALPGTFWFFIGLTLSVYMNTALATLNVRQHLVKSSRFVRGFDMTLSEMVPASHDTDVESAKTRVASITKHVPDMSVSVDRTQLDVYD